MVIQFRCVCIEVTLDLKPSAVVVRSGLCWNSNVREICWASLEEPVVYPPHQLPWDEGRGGVPV